LALAAMMVLRDAGLPQPVGVSYYLPNGFIHKASPANPIKDNTDVKQRLSRIQYYAYNSALDIPYVSPILADDLGGLGEIFITCGNCERLRDESILFAHKAAKTYPEIFNTPRKEGQRSYPPTKVTVNAIKRTGKWIRKVIPEPINGDNKSESSSNDMLSLFTYCDIKPKIHEEFSISDISDEIDDDEFEIFTTKYVDIKGNSRPNEILDEKTIKEWIKMLGKLPDINKHPELLE
ncbi:14175_t:CDS:2, partial [Cetraspora pellucida]